MHIKVELAKVQDGTISTKVTKDLETIFAKYGLKIVENDDIGEKLQYSDREIEGTWFRFLFIRPFDIITKIGDFVSKGRATVQSKEEVQDIVNYCSENGFELVDSLPVQEIV